MDAFDLHDRVLWYSYGQDDEKYAKVTYLFKATVTKEVTVTIPKEEIGYMEDHVYDDLCDKLDDFSIDNSTIFITDQE